MACLGSRRHDRISCKPRYKRAVNGVYPANRRTEGLVADGLDRLIYFILQEPQKLDVVGSYLVKQSRKHANGRQVARIKVDLGILDALTFAGQGIISSVYVELFLESIQVILEANIPEVHPLAVSLFVKFTSSREDVPNCYKRLRHFVRIFCSMCRYQSVRDEDVTSVCRIRYDGLRGLQGLVRKSLSSDLRCNFWEDVKEIIPALLHNIRTCRTSLEATNDSNSATIVVSYSSSVHSPAILAEHYSSSMDSSTLQKLSVDILNYLGSRSQYDHTTAVVKPALRYIEVENLWTDSWDEARVCVESLVMCAQIRFKHIIAKHLIIALNENASSGCRKRYGIALSVLNCLENVVDNLPTHSYIREILYSLLDQLERSFGISRAIGQDKTADEELEKSLQDLLMKAITKVTQIFSDYQKIDVIIILSDYIGDSRHSELMTRNFHKEEIRTQLLHRMLSIAEEVKFLRAEESIPTKLLESLKRLACLSDEKLRPIVLTIINSLVDTNNNRAKLYSRISNSRVKQDLTMPPSRHSAHSSFADNYREMLGLLFDVAKLPDNTAEIYRQIYVGAVLVSIEMVPEECVAGLVRFSLFLQTFAIAQTQLSAEQVLMIHALVAALMIRAGRLNTEGKELRKCVDSVLNHRKKFDSESLPEAALRRNNIVKVASVEAANEKVLLQEGSLFSADIILALPGCMSLSERLQGLNYESFCSSSQFQLVLSKSLTSDSAESDEASRAVSNEPEIPTDRMKSVTFENDPSEDFDLWSLKKMMMKRVDANTRANLQEKRHKELFQFFMNSSWSEILERVNSSSEAKTKRDELLASLDEQNEPFSLTGFLSDIFASKKNSDDKVEQLEEAYSLPSFFI